MKRKKNKILIAIFLMLVLSITSALAGDLGNFNKVLEYEGRKVFEKLITQNI